MGKRRPKIVDGFEIDQPESNSIGDAATAVMERRRHGSKSSQLDWIRLVNGQRLSEYIPPAIVGEVASACEIAGDSWTLFMVDAKDLSDYLRYRNHTNKVEPFIEEHGDMASLVKKREAIEKNLKAINAEIDELNQCKRIDNACNGPGMACFNNNKRLFPDRNETLLQEAGIT